MNGNKRNMKSGGNYYCNRTGTGTGRNIDPVKQWYITFFYYFSGGQPIQRPRIYCTTFMVFLTKPATLY